MWTPNKGDYRYHLEVSSQNKIKTLERRLEKFESGAKYKELKERAEKWHRRYERKVKGHTKALRQRDRECDRRIRLWQQAADDVEEKYEKLQEDYDELAAAHEALKEVHAQTMAELADKASYIKTLEHRLGMNSNNSSIPSSADRGRIASHKNNSRQRTDRKPGAQPGHPHHPRRKLTPNQEPVYLSGRPAGTEGDDDWYMTETYCEKLLVGLRLFVPVTLYRALIWRNRRTGATKTSPFPFNMRDEVTYAPELKTFIVFCTQHLNVAVRKVKELLQEGTRGVLNVSTGWICQLLKEFAEKSDAEMAAIFQGLFRSDVMGVDTTVTRNNGSREAITVACSPEMAMFVHTAHKGREAAEALPCAPGSGYTGTITSDREITFLGLGGTHQQCLAHHIRDLRSISEREPEITWAPDMISLMQEMIHASHLWGDQGATEEQIQDFEARYDQILQRGRQEYIEAPPSRHFLKGHNMRVLLAQDKEMVLLFLHDPAVPPTNNDSERCLRGHKRKLRQVISFRAGEYIDHHCIFLSLETTARKSGRSVFPVIEQIFSKPVRPSAQTP